LRSRNMIITQRPKQEFEAYTESASGGTDEKLEHWVDSEGGRELQIPRLADLPSTLLGRPDSNDSLP
jgi:hypothetical protein